MTEHDMADAIIAAIIDTDEDDGRFDLAHDPVTFADAGVLTQNAGLVVRTADGTEYQVTVVRSR